MTSPASRSSAPFALGALTLAFALGGCEIDRDGGGYFMGGPDYPAGAGLGGVASGGAGTGGARTGGTETGGAETGGTETGGTETGGTETGGTETGGTETGGAAGNAASLGGTGVGGAPEGGAEAGGAAGSSTSPGGSAAGGADTGGTATGGGEPGGAGVGGAEAGGVTGASGSAGSPGGGAATGGAATGGVVSGGVAGTSGGGVAGSAGASGGAGAAGGGAATGGFEAGGDGGEGGEGEDTNLIDNSGFEAGLEGWEIYGAGPRSNVSISATTAAAHGGEQCLLVADRDRDEQGPSYVLTGLVSEGETYRLVVWARLPEDAAYDPIYNFGASVRVTCGTTSSTVRVLQEQTVSSEAWSEHTGTFSAECTIGTPSAVVLYFHAPSPVRGFYIDDVVVQPVL